MARTLERMGQPVSDADRVPQHADAGERPSIRTLLSSDYRVDTLALWAAFLSCMLTVYLAFNWIPSMLADAGFSSSLASAGITAFNLGGLAGALAGGLSITRWGSRTAMLSFTAMAAVSAAIMSRMTYAPGAAAFPILAMLAVTGGMINAVQSTMFALAAHVYPAGIRATGVGAGASFGRLGAVISGYVGVWALDFHGPASFFGVIAASLVVCGIALAASDSSRAETSLTPKASGSAPLRISPARGRAGRAPGRTSAGLTGDSVSPAQQSAEPCHSSDSA